MAQSSHQHRGGPQASFGAGSRATHPARPATVSFPKVAFGQKIDSKLYSNIAEEAAQNVAQDKSKNRPAQLRRFYDELVLLHDKVGSDKERFDQHLPFIQMLKAKVAYATGRGHVDETFRSLLCRVVDQTVDVDTLRQARLFMEAFMAYYKVYRPSEG